MASAHNRLRVFASVFRIVAWVALGVGAIGSVGIVLGGAPDTPRPMGLLVLLVAALYFCLFSTLDGIIRVLLSIEEQTRKP